MLKYDGILTFISSNKYFRSGYGRKLREYLVRHTLIRNLIDFGDAPVFTAIAYPSIITFKKNKATDINPHIPSGAVHAFNWKQDQKIEDFADIFHANHFPLNQKELTSDGWRLEPPDVLRLLDKIRNIGKPLHTFISDKVYYGIKTGLNKAFVVNRQTRDRLIDEHQSSSDILRPFLRGKDVKRWSAKFADQYLIKIESSLNKMHPWSGKSEKDAEKIFERTYPAIYKHLKKFQTSLIKRDDQGKYFWELRSCKYWDEFDKPKIIYPDIAQHSEFAYDKDGYFLGNTLYLLPTDKIWLIGLLNSKVVFWFYTKISTQIRGGFVRFIAQYVSQIPIPNTTKIKEIESLTDQVINSSNLDKTIYLTVLEAEIDGRVAHLYNL